jgi:hypothetical protein
LKLFHKPVVLLCNFFVQDVKYWSRDILCTEVSHKGKSCSIFLNQHNLIWSKYQTGYIMWHSRLMIYIPWGEFSYQTGYIMWHSRLMIYIPFGCASGNIYPVWKPKVYTLLSSNYHYNGKSVCTSIFQIKAFYLKKLHFNCTFSLNPVILFEKYWYILIFHYSDNSKKVRYILLVSKTKFHVQVVEIW